MYSPGMTTRNLYAFSLALSVLPALAACSQPKPEPEIVSSAPHGGYAKNYPADLSAAIKGWNDHRAEARKGMGEWNGYPGKLKDPNWGHVLEVVERADEDGRSWQYVDRVRRLEGVQSFWDAEKDEINKKVVGSVSYTAKKKSCDVDVAGAAPPALKDAVEKQMEKELRDASEAQQLVERYRVELGKENAAALEKEADDLSKVSYLVHIVIVEDKLRISRMVTEADQIKHTADDTIAAERAFQAGKKVTDAEKKASEQRIADLNKSKAAVDSAVKQAENIVPNLDDEVKKIQKEYDDAFEALKSKLKEKAH
jgi:hypothetical protein